MRPARRFRASPSPSTRCAARSRKCGRRSRRPRRRGLLHTARRPTWWRGWRSTRRHHAYRYHSVMTSFFAADALLPEGWAKNVRIEIDSSGNFSSIQKNSDSKGAQSLSGPALPGMANLHSHAFQRAMAGLAEIRSKANDDFWSWRELMYKFVQRLTPDGARAIAAHLYVDMLKHGYTAAGEFHYVHDGAAAMMEAH